MKKALKSISNQWRCSPWSPCSWPELPPGRLRPRTGKRQWAARAPTGEGSSLRRERPNPEGGPADAVSRLDEIAIHRQQEDSAYGGHLDGRNAGGPAHLVDLDLGV
jgi:hypothetical protein